MKRLKKIKSMLLSRRSPLLLSTLTLCAITTHAHAIEVASSPNPVGSGARAMGMGSAFIAVADDATAASWNPAGLIQLEKPEISAVASWYRRKDDFSSESMRITVSDESGTMNDGISLGGESDAPDVTTLNYLSAAYPFKLFDRNMVVSLNRQHLYGFNKDNTFRKSDDIFWTDGVSVMTMEQSLKQSFNQSGGLYTISPAIAGQVTPTLSLGATFNFWSNPFESRNGWVEKYRIRTRNRVQIDDNPPAEYLDKAKQKITYDFSGFNMNFGFLWNVTPMITVGGVYKTPFEGDLRRVDRHSITTTDVTDPDNPVVVTSDSSKNHEHWDMRMPKSYGLGVAVRFSDAFSVAFDVYRTEWGDFLYVLPDGSRISPVTLMSPREQHVDATNQIHLGAEYLFIRPETVIPVRVGVFYDPEPGFGDPEDYYGFSVGTGYMWKNLVFDMAYQYRFGNDVDGDTVGMPGTHANVQQHFVLASTIWHF